MRRLIVPVVFSLLGGLATPLVAQAIAEEPSPPKAVVDTDADGRFELTIDTPKATWAIDEPIEVAASFAYLKQKGKAVVTTGGPGIVVFEVEQFDGPIDSGTSRDMSCVRHVFRPGDVESYPFRKSGSFDPSSDMGGFWREWFRDPELRLPEGRFRITAHADYGPKSCGEVSSPEAAVTIHVVALEEASSDPSAGESGLLISIVGAIASLPSLAWPDAPAPSSIARFVPVVREQLWGQAIDGLRLPLHLRFVEARCQVYGPGVALVFEEIGPPYLSTTYAYAVRGSMPASEEDAWSGGYGLSDVLADPEFVHLMGADTVPCS